MSEKYQNKYRIPSNRKPGWDYSGDGMYFLTIVTQNRECNLGAIVETHGRASLQSTTTTSFQSTTHQSPLLESSPDNLNGTIKRNPAIRLPKSISSFIAGFKSIINTKIDDYIDDNHLNLPKYNRNNHFFQPNYHDRIIRNHVEYERIQNYIANNPSNWKDDKFYE